MSVPTCPRDAFVLFFGETFAAGCHGFSALPSSSGLAKASKKSSWALRASRSFRSPRREGLEVDSHLPECRTSQLIAPETPGRTRGAEHTFGHGSKSRLSPSEHPNPHKNRLKWVVHLPQDGIPLVLTRGHLTFPIKEWFSLHQPHCITARGPRSSTSLAVSKAALSRTPVTCKLHASCAPGDRG